MHQSITHRMTSARVRSGSARVMRATLVSSRFRFCAAGKRTVVVEVDGCTTATLWAISRKPESAENRETLRGSRHPRRRATRQRQRAQRLLVPVRRGRGAAARSVLYTGGRRPERVCERMKMSSLLNGGSRGWAKYVLSTTLPK